MPPELGERPDRGGNEKRLKGIQDSRTRKPSCNKWLTKLALPLGATYY